MNRYHNFNMFNVLFCISPCSNLPTWHCMLEYVFTGCFGVCLVHSIFIHIWCFCWCELHAAKGTKLKFRVMYQKCIKKTAQNQTPCGNHQQTYRAFKLFREGRIGKDCYKYAHKDCGAFFLHFLLCSSQALSRYHGRPISHAMTPLHFSTENWQCQHEGNLNLETWRAASSSDTTPTRQKTCILQCCKQRPEVFVSNHARYQTTVSPCDNCKSWKKNSQADNIMKEKHRSKPQNRNKCSEPPRATHPPQLTQTPLPCTATSVDEPRILFTTQRGVKTTTSANCKTMRQFWKLR